MALDPRTPRYHEDAYMSLLLAYAAGRLDQAQSLIVASHLAFSEKARRCVDEFERLGGALLERECAPVAMKAASLEAVLRRLGPHAPTSQQQGKPARSLHLSCGLELPAALQDCVNPDTCHLEWTALTPGLDSMDIPLECRKSRLQLFRAGPAFAMPHHRHEGMEIMLVLEGAFMDDGQFYGRGDMVVEEKDSAHSVTACKKQGCVSMVVTSGSVRLAGLAGILSAILRL